MKKLFLIAILLHSEIVSAAEDSVTLMQSMLTLLKILESTERALSYDETNMASLALSTWSDLGGISKWDARDGSLGLSQIGEMSKLTFNTGSETNTVDFNLNEAIHAIQNKKDFNFKLSNQIVSLQTESIKNDANVLKTLSKAAHTPKGQLQALQVLLQISIQNLQQQRQVRAQMAFDSQWQINKEKAEAEEKRLHEAAIKRVYDTSFKPKPKSAYKRYN